MAIKIVIANNKGGIGKTSTSINLADIYTRSGYKVLVIDADPQGNTTSTFGAKTEDTYTMCDVLQEQCEPREAIQQTAFCDIIPNEIVTENLQLQLTSQIGGINCIKKIARKVDKDYDFIIIDTPPAGGLFMQAALTAGDYLIIPIFPSIYSMDGLANMAGVINKIIEETNENLKVLGILLCKYDGRTSTSKDVWEQLKSIAEMLGTESFDTKIGTDENINKAQGERASLFDKYKSSRGANDYVALAMEIIDKMNIDRKGN